MTLTRMRMRVRVSKYIILVNHIGTKMGTKFLYLYFIDIKQLLNASKWRCIQTNKIAYLTKILDVDNNKNVDNN
jgi:hypothetical protein